MDPVCAPRGVEDLLEVVVVGDVPASPHVLRRLADDPVPAEIHDCMGEAGRASEHL